MKREEFEKIVEAEFPEAIPEKFRHLIKNVAFLVEEESPEEDLLGLYQGIPATARGDLYGVGATLPDTITLYRKAIEEEATHMQYTCKLEFISMSYEECVRRVIRETIWHEVAHYFGFDEDQVQRREDERDMLK